jgi:acyl-CoA reductase-like NAD-dependent aldehyde dehydrogenase
MTPVATSLFVDLLAESGVPSGWINLLFGGSDLGQALFASRDFARYTFTGSRRVGMELVQRVGLRPVILEMGSNAPNIVHSDAEMDVAIGALIDGAFATAGQVCIRPQRILVHSAIYDEFLDAFVEAIRGLTVGDPRKPETDMGPMRTEEAATRVAQWVADAVAAGARVLVGGQHVGSYMEPTVLCDVPTGEKVVCEEIFGPVVVVERYLSLDDAILRANDSPYGLQAGVFSRDLATCMDVVERLRMGSVMVNDSSRLRIPHVPFGGIKESGWGREGGALGVEEFTDLKTVLIRR